MNESSRHTVQTDAIGPDVDSVTACDLVVIDGPDEGRSIPLEEAPLTVGTDDSCDLVLSDSRVSSSHLRVAVGDDGYTVRDLGSANGVIYRGSLVSEATVPPGATLRLGHTYVRIEPRPEAADVTPSQRRRFGDLVAESLAMREVFAVMELAAESDVHVLITGETGTGKQLAAKAIHNASERSDAPFVTVDCGALPDDLLESELFGHVEGAFTGATGERGGAFRRADGGTVFLDELDSMSADAQSRLLRVCEDQVVRPVGADDEISVDVRVVGAGRDLESEMADGEFRSDLYYRLSVVHIRMPALADRIEDVAPITRTLLRDRGFEVEEVEGPNLDRLRAHDWPGNVRELRNVLERALALSPGADTFDDLRIRIQPETGRAGETTVRTDLPFKEAKSHVVEEFERRYLRDVYERCDGNISATARAADLNRKYVRKLLEKHDIL